MYVGLYQIILESNGYTTTLTTVFVITIVSYVDNPRTLPTRIANLEQGQRRIARFHSSLMIENTQHLCHRSDTISLYLLQQLETQIILAPTIHLNHSILLQIDTSNPGFLLSPPLIIGQRALSGISRDIMSPAILECSPVRRGLIER